VRMLMICAKGADKMKRPGRGVHACLKAWPNHNDEPSSPLKNLAMAMAS